VVFQTAILLTIEWNVLDMISEDVFESDYPNYKGQVKNIERLEGRSGDFVMAHSVLPEKLAIRLPYDELYTHQADAIEQLHNDKNVCVTTSTASGKTLVYALRMAELIEEDSNATGLFLYPTKALSRDQKQEISQLYEEMGLDISIGVYDGDTDSNEKREIRESSDVIITNFQGLNYYLPHHDKWERFLRNLQLVVVDESHMYRGVQGIHTAYIIRRLKRIANDYYSQPQFVLTSATIGNPKQHTETLIGDDVSVIENDTSPKGATDIVFWQPPQAGTENRSSHKESSELLGYITSKGLQSLLFAPSRQSTELCLRHCQDEDWISDSLKFNSYNAGHTKKERRNVEDDLKDGSVDGVITTTALEVGIDIGSIDAAIIDTYPGQRTSFWQQIGRAGRSPDKRSIAMFVADNESVDQYILNNPDFLLEDDVEDAVIDIENLKIAKKQIRAAANELSLQQSDLDFFPKQIFQTSIHELQKEGEIEESPLSNQISYIGDNGRPESDISLYASSEKTFTPVIVINDDVVSLPEVGIERAFRDFHYGATYYHKGTKYEVIEFDAKSESIRLAPTDVQYYTQSSRTVEIENLIETDSFEPIDGVTIKKGTGVIKEYYDSYSKIYPDRGETEHGHDTGISKPISLETQLFWFEIDDGILNDIRENGPRQQSLGGLHAAEHALIKMVPTVLMADSKNIGGLSTLAHPEIPSQSAGIFIYDGVSGGVGFSHKMYQNIENLMSRTINRLENCSCESDEGCLSCTMSPMCGDGNEPLDRVQAADILNYIQE